MKTKISITDFTFTFAGYGHYRVTYQSPKTGKCWMKTISDMQLIDLTKNQEYPKQVNLIRLKNFVKL